MTIHSNHNRIRIHVLDVGHGSSIILEFPNRRQFGIIDCRVHPPTNRLALAKQYSTAEPKALSFFRERVQGGSVEALFACVTHPHIDHFFGLSTLLRGLRELKIPVKQYWSFGATELVARAMAHHANDEPSHERALEEYYLILQELNELRNIVPGFRAFPLSVHEPGKVLLDVDGVRIVPIAPTGDCEQSYRAYLMLKSDSERSHFRKQYPDSSSGNLISSAFLIQYGQFRCVIGGDLTNYAWEDIIKKKGGWQGLSCCSAIAVSHHGSLDGSRPFKSPLWGHIFCEKPKTAVISGGYRLNLPHPTVVEELRAIKAETYVTGSCQVQFKPLAIPGAKAISPMELFDIRQVDSDAQSGCGDVVITGYENGKSETVQELPAHY